MTALSKKQRTEEVDLSLWKNSFHFSNVFTLPTRCFPTGLTHGALTDNPKILHQILASREKVQCVYEGIPFTLQNRSYTEEGLLTKKIHAALKDGKNIFWTVIRITWGIGTQYLNVTITAGPKTAEAAITTSETEIASSEAVKTAEKKKESPLTAAMAVTKAAKEEAAVKGEEEAKMAEKEEAKTAESNPDTVTTLDRILIEVADEVRFDPL